MTRYPAPLRIGDRIGVTAPSSPVPAALVPRLEFAIACLQRRGYDVVRGEHLVGEGLVSAPVEARAAELTSMLTDPSIRAIVPPWGGELAIDLVGVLDWDAIAAADPTWLVGFSDIATLITPLTLLTNVATVHGAHLMDTPYRTPEGMLHWLDLVSAEPGSTLTQESPGRFREHGHDDWRSNPELTEMTLDGCGRWGVVSGPESLTVSGRLIGGCIETLGPLSGSRYLNLMAYAQQHAGDGLLVYVEAAQSEATDIARHLHGMRLSGFFDHASAVIIGRSTAPDSDGYTQREAVQDALGPLGVPVIAGVECGHVAPFLPIVNGALGRLEVSAAVNRLEQSLV